MCLHANLQSAKKTQIKFENQIQDFPPPPFTLPAPKKKKNFRNKYLCKSAAPTNQKNKKIKTSQDDVDVKIYFPTRNLN